MEVDQMPESRDLVQGDVLLTDAQADALEKLRALVEALERGISALRGARKINASTPRHLTGVGGYQ